jgi:UDP-N-acetylmuramate dehydrogenase
MRSRKWPASIRGCVTEESPLWAITSMRIGGPARWVVRPNSESGLADALAWAEAASVPSIVLGAGTNVLVSDRGWEGLIIRTCDVRGIQAEAPTVTAACGEPLSALAARMNRAGLSGLEWACGIPGTVGGAVVMNAGTRDGDVASVLAGVRVLTHDGPRDVPAEDLALGYRTSAWRIGAVTGIILQATFTLRADSPASCLKRERDILEARRRTQPAGASAGCIFKNPAGQPPAGALLDRAGCKGLRVDRAVVSEQHANFIINEGTNNAADVLQLIERMRTRVRDAYGIHLDLEVDIIGKT